MVKIIFLLFLVFGVTPLYADVVYLKNGRSIEGVISKDNDQEVELELSYGSVHFTRSEVLRVEKAWLKDNLSLRKGWNAQRKDTEEAFKEQQKKDEQKPRTVEFDRMGNSIVVRATLNRKTEASLVLDTGASLVILRRRVARSLGINVDRLAPNQLLTMADGRTVNAAIITLDHVKVQNSEAHNVQAAVMLQEIDDSSFGDGLLGMSFLGRFNFKIDQQEKELILEKL